MTGAYIAEPYDEADPVVRDADMQAALTDYALLVSPSFTTPVIGAATGTSLVLSGLLDLRKASTANILQYATNGFLRTDTSQLTLHNAGTGRDDISFSRNGSTMVLSSAFALGFCDNVNASGGSIDVQISRLSSGVVQIGTTAANALGTLRAETIVANNNLNCFQVIVGNGGGARLKDGSGDLEILNNAGSARAGVRALAADITNGVTCGNVTASGTVRLGSYTVATLPSAAANTRARAFVTDSNLAFNSTNLGSTVTAGGSTLVPVFSNGTNWVIG